jgi:SAM-dependent methyltransferase
MPNQNELARLKDTKFKGTEKDYSIFITVLDALGVERNARLFDFGCSWGYGSWQFSQSGFEVESYEISEPRRSYAISNLGCTVYASLADVRPGFDVFFSSHVLEHVPLPQDVIEYAVSVLKPGGLFIAFTPNGSMAHRLKNPTGWQKLWGLAHPNFLDDQYYCRRFDRFPHLLASDPYNLEEIRSWDSSKQTQRILDLSGPELMCAVKIERLHAQAGSNREGRISDASASSTA